LVVLDLEDYGQMGILNKVHIKKITVELAKIYKFSEDDHNLDNKEHLIRRERIRKAKMYSTSALTVQRYYRGYLTRRELRYAAEVERVTKFETERRAAMQRDSTWWMERHVPYELPPIKTFGKRRDHLACKGWGRYENGKWIALKLEKHNDYHPTRVFTEKLHDTHYDERRANKFKGLKPTITMAIEHMHDSSDVSESDRSHHA
jgi:hypothetical protein